MWYGVLSVPLGVLWKSLTSADSQHCPEVTCVCLHWPWDSSCEYQVDSFISQRLHHKASMSTVLSAPFWWCPAQLGFKQLPQFFLHCTYCCYSAINWSLLLCFMYSLSCKWLCKAMGKASSGRMKGFKTLYSVFNRGCQKIFQHFLFVEKDNDPSSESTYP